ncbi:MAG: TIGR03808 family TAT-translocated repetitive protein [Propylenella sp.]
MHWKKRGITRRAALGALSWAALGPCVATPGRAVAQALRSGLFDAADPTLTPGSPDDQSEVLMQALARAEAESRPLFLRPGRYEISGVMLPSYAHLVGVPGETRLAFRGGRFMLEARHARALRLDGVTLDGAGLPMSAPALLDANDVDELSIDDCRVTGSAASGVTLRDAAGRVTRSDFSGIRRAGIDIAQSRGMEILSNSVADCGDTGILIARDEEGADNSIVTGNRVSRIRAESGGTGENGNGINLDKANGVIVSGNRIDECAFSAIRCFSSDGVSVTGNVATRSGEMAIYVEFSFEGAVVADNLIDTAVGGISLTNFFRHGGRLGTVSGNVVRRISGGPTYPDGNPQTGAGISAEADVAITGNVVEDAVWGLQLGWGPHLRDVAATGNVIRRTQIGVAVSVVEGAGPALITGNLVTGAERGAILGMRWDEVATGELGDGKEAVEGVTVVGNKVG